VIANLAQKNIRISTARLTDLTLAGAKKEIYSAVLNALLASDHCDLVLAVVGSSAQYQPDIAIEPIVEAQTGGKPLPVFCAPHAEESLKLLADAGIAGFRTPESCADAIRAWRDWRPPVEAPAPDRTKLAAVQHLLGKSTKLNEREACRIFAALGVAQAESQVIATPEEAVSIGFPVVAKVLSSDIAHKTEAGGVILGITDAAALRTSTKEMLARVRSRHPDARIDGILVQHMEQGLAEVIVGYRLDPQVGPIVMLGIGGVLAEIYRDIALRLAPVSAAQALDMIGEVKGLAMIRGFRKLPRGDLSALANAVSAFSQLAAIEEVLEAEINPLIVKGESEGVVAVDGLIIKSGDMAQPMRAA
jgi:acyl-CoA synthetase (NDP forming)